MYQEPQGSSYVLWIIFIIAAIVIIAIIIGGFVVYYQNNNKASTNPSNNPIGQQVGQRCETQACASGSICATASNGEKICMGLQGSSCRNSLDCAGTLTCNSGICAIPLVPPTPPSSGNHVYCWNGSSWILKYTLPTGFVPTRITASGTNLLAISTTTNSGLVYYYNGSSWINLSTYYNSPGTLVDGVISGNSIYLVYQNFSGQTIIYQLSNYNNNGLGISLTALPAPVSNLGQPITINQIAVSPTNGDIFISGVVSGTSSPTVYRKSLNSPNFTSIATGQNVFTNPSGYAFSSGSSILFVNEVTSSGSNRVDGVFNVNSLAVDASNSIWYISNNQIYRQGQVIAQPNNIPVNSSSQLYYSTIDGICFFTPGY